MVKAKMIELIGRRYKMQRDIERAIKPLIGKSLIISYPKVLQKEYKEPEGRIHLNKK